MDSRDNALDGLRGLAILIVIFHHTGLALSPAHLELPWALFFSRITFYGWLGVDLFFVLSGYLITNILLDTRNSPNYYSAFYLRRAVRIFPLYYTVLLPVLALVLLANLLGHRFGHFDLNPLVVGSALTYTLNILVSFRNPDVEVPLLLVHFWSLCVEEQFYAFWPPIVRVFSTLSLKRILVVFFFLSLAFRMFFGALDLRGAVTAFLLCRLDGLGCGAAVAILIRDASCREWLNRYWRPLAIVGALGFLGTVFFSTGLYPPRIYGRSFAVIAFAAFLAGIVIPTHSMARSAMDRPSLRFFGKYSYALYVLHPFAIFLIAHRLPRNLVPPAVDFFTFQILIFALSIAAAMLSWRFLESPFLALKRHKPFQYRPVLP